jgi:SAM-dependent methyltransferase
LNTIEIHSTNECLHAVDVTASQSSEIHGHWEPALGELMAKMPVSLAIREIHRMVKFTDILAKYNGPVETILDVGCGDGSWWQSLPAKQGKIFGIDISNSVIVNAKDRMDDAALIDVSSPTIQSELQSRNWPATYDLVIGNCSLEHVPDINAALSNISYLLDSGGKFILFVPTPDWAMRGIMLSLLKKYAPRLAMTFSGAANGFFQHWHLMDANTWKIILERHGFDLEEVSVIGGKKTEWLFRFGLPFSFLSFIYKSIAGFYPVNLCSKRLVTLLTKKVFAFINEDLSASAKGDHHDEYSIEYAFNCVKK